MAARKVVRIGCCDPRVEKDGVYYFGSTGAAVYPELLSNMSPVLGAAQELQLVGHHDCGASRLRLGLPFSGELSPVDAERVDRETRRFLHESELSLKAEPALKRALETGLAFHVGFDTLEKGIAWIN